MIKLTKTAVPQVLKDNAKSWTIALLTEIASGGDEKQARLKRYNNSQIKDALKAETHGKCAYCESDHLHVSSGHIEHIVPKSIAPELAFDWSNLTLACEICNIKKGIKEGLIDPYINDPEKEFDFEGPMIMSCPGRTAAERTSAELKLNRPPLLEKRAEKLKGLKNQLERLYAAQDQKTREYLIQVITNEETRSENEYCACTRVWVASQKSKGRI